jgi:chromate reductase, NAD(P)H dehydrogenase (quinone)
MSATSLKILGIAGSLRAASFNRGALRAARELAPDGMTIDIFDLRGLPVFNQDDEPILPPRAIELKERIRESDAVLFATPEHNFGIPAALKNAIDWASRPWGDSAWAGKPAAIMGASVGRVGTARAQLQLRQMFVFLDVLCINQPEVMIPFADEKFDVNGNLIDPMSRDKIRELLESLATWVHRLSSSDREIGELMHRS